MALADVKKYFKTFEKAHIERRAILAQAQEALKDKYLPEEKVRQLEATYEKYDSTYQFFAHIMYLLALPTRGRKKKEARAKNDFLETHFSDFGLDEASIKLENEDVLVNFRKYVKEFQKESSEE